MRRHQIQNIPPRQLRETVSHPRQGACLRIPRVHGANNGVSRRLSGVSSCSGITGACLSISREPRWQGRISVRCSWAWPTPLDSARGADARRAARPVVVTTGKPCNAADAPALRSVRAAKYNGCARAKCLANPSGPGRFPLMRRCRLLIGSLPNGVGSALPEGKSAAVAATRNTQTGSQCEAPGTRAAFHWYHSDMMRNNAQLQHRPFLMPIWLSVLGALVVMSFLGLEVWVWTTADSTTIIVGRHAAKDPGSADPPLSSAGQARAEMLARMFGDVHAPGHIDAIYVSPTVRSQM